MAEYHVGCGAFEIYAGTLNQNKTLWKNKSVVTDEAIQAVAIFLLEHEQCLKFERNGKKYVLNVKEVYNGNFKA